MSRYLLDTAIIIDVLRAKQEALTWIDTLTQPPYLSAATVMELYAGVKGAREEKQLATLIAHSQILDISSEIGVRAGQLLKQYRPSHGTDPVDAMIAATAEVHELTLVTHNLKHFPMFPGLTRPF